MSINKEYNKIFDSARKMGGYSLTTSWVFNI